MKLKCIECLLRPDRGVRDAITVLDGYAVCRVHLRAHINYSMEKAKKIREEREKKEGLEKKKEEEKPAIKQ